MDGSKRAVKRKTLSFQKSYRPTKWTDGRMDGRIDQPTRQVLGSRVREVAFPRLKMCLAAFLEISNDEDGITGLGIDIISVLDLVHDLI